MTARNAAKQATPPTQALPRRSFLRYVGIGAAAAGAPVFYHCGKAERRGGADSAAQGAEEKARIAAETGYNWVSPEGAPNWKQPPYPVPLPADAEPVDSDARRLARFTARDELVLPEGFRYDVVASWGDRIGPEGRQVRFGFNNDYTGITPVPGKEEEYWLFVNHEDLSGRPWLEGYATAVGGDLPRVELTPNPENPRGSHAWINGEKMPRNVVSLDRDQVSPEIREALHELGYKGLDDLGVSAIQVRRDAKGRLSVVEDGLHWRISGVSRREDPRRTIRVSGPAAPLFSGPPAGTFGNCSGGTAPWGVFLTCEENLQNHVYEPVNAAGQPAGARGGELSLGNSWDYSSKLPLYINGLGTILKEPLDGRHYGWVCEVNPRTGDVVKHTGLGRFRHENAGIRCQAGKRLAVYMGDDRRGGHVWKFVSDETVNDPADPGNSRLFEKGTLYVARFDPDFSGRWIPLTPETPLAKPDPAITALGRMKLPARPEGGWTDVGVDGNEGRDASADEWVAAAAAFAGKPFEGCVLGDLVKPEGVEPGAPEYRGLQDGIIKMDAFAMANAAGGTPTARPEDIEVHPFDHSVYISFTDATGGSDGSPDKRVFPESALETSRRYGAIYRLAENGDDPAATRFSWGKFVSSGEAADGGGGFACADNLTFDPLGNLWMVTDISGSKLNTPTDRDRRGTRPGQSSFPGVFGNNAMFMIPTEGPNKGAPFCFAVGPAECEMTGLTFTPDGKTLIVSIQHPGEQHGARTAANPSASGPFEVADRNGKIFKQVRDYPIGSNFPSKELGAAPRPSVVCITRA